MIIEHLIHHWIESSVKRGEIKTAIIYNIKHYEQTITENFGSKYQSMLKNTDSYLKISTMTEIWVSQCKFLKIIYENK